MALADELKGQYGTVILRDHFWPDTYGKEHSGISGHITVLAAKDALGFDVSNRDSNWLVQVRGESGAVILPGCAVLGFHYHEPTSVTDYLRV